MPAVPTGYTFSYPDETTTINQPITFQQPSKPTYVNPNLNYVSKLPPAKPPTVLWTVANDIIHPIDAIDNTTAFKDASKAIGKTVNAVDNFYDETVSGIKFIGKELEIGFNDFEKGSVWLFDETKQITSELYNGTRKTVRFIENYYKPMLLIGGIYITAKFVNEVKNAI